MRADRTGPTVLSASGISKSFAGRTVLADFGLDLYPGEVHGLLGQNGSGKSTLIKVLSGYHAPDPGGSLSVRGRAVSLPLEGKRSRDAGLCFVHQDLGLEPDMTVLENMRLGNFATRAGWRIPWRAERRRVREELERFGLDVSPDAKVKSLREVERTMLAVLRALEQVADAEGGVLILDEPTASLPRDGADRLFAAVRSVADRRFGVVLVTHRLEEALGETDRLTILRDGRKVATVETSSLDEAALVELIVGRSVGDLYPQAHRVADEVVLSVEGMVGPGLARPFSLRARQGEVIGLTGLVGMGYESPLYLLAGAIPSDDGTIQVGAATGALAKMSPARALAMGVALLPADRLGLSGSADASVVENVSLPILPRFFRGGRLRHAQVRTLTDGLLESFQVTPPEIDLGLAKLSGGNQQKALMAKALTTDPRVLLLHEPTQGVDVGARQQLFRHVRDAADAGTSVLVASAEYDDLAHLCDRVLVFRDGAVTRELHRSELTEQRILRECLVDRTKQQTEGTMA